MCVDCVYSCKNLVVLLETVCFLSGRKCEMLKRSTVFLCVSGSSVGRATYCGLDGPGSDPGGDVIFRPSRPALWPTQPPVQWVTGLSRG